VIFINQAILLEKYLLSIEYKIYKREKL